MVLRVSQVKAVEVGDILKEVACTGLATRLPCCRQGAELLEETQQIIVCEVADNHPVPDLVHLAGLEPHRPTTWRQCASRALQWPSVRAKKHTFDRCTVLRGKEVGHFYPGIGTGGNKARELLLHALRTTDLCEKHKSC